MPVPIFPQAPVRMAGVRGTDTNSLIRYRDAASALARSAPTAAERERATRAASRFAGELRRRGVRA